MEFFPQGSSSLLCNALQASHPPHAPLMVPVHYLHTPVQTHCSLRDFQHQNSTNLPENERKKRGRERNFRAFWQRGCSGGFGGREEGPCRAGAALSVSQLSSPLLLFVILWLILQCKHSHSHLHHPAAPYSGHRNCCWHLGTPPSPLKHQDFPSDRSSSV